MKKSSLHVYVKPHSHTPLVSHHLSTRIHPANQRANQPVSQPSSQPVSQSSSHPVTALSCTSPVEGWHVERVLRARRHGPK